MVCLLTPIIIAKFMPKHPPGKAGGVLYSLSFIEDG
jgi:hypothetical protein